MTAKMKLVVSVASISSLILLMSHYCIQTFVGIISAMTTSPAKKTVNPSVVCFIYYLNVNVLININKLIIVVPHAVRSPLLA